MSGKGWKSRQKRDTMDAALIAEMQGNEKFKKKRSNKEMENEDKKNPFSNVEDFDVESVSGSSSEEDRQKPKKSKDKDNGKDELSKLWWCCASIIWLVYLVILVAGTAALSACFWLVSGCAQPLCFLGFTFGSFLIVQIVFCPIFCICRRMKKKKKLRIACFVVEVALVFVIIQLMLVFILPTSSVFADKHGNIPGSSDSLFGRTAPSQFQSCNASEMMEEAKDLFGQCIDYDKVNVVYGGLPRLYAGRPRAMGIDSTVMVASCATANTFIHEMAHVWQFQRRVYFYDITGPAQLFAWFRGQSGDSASVAAYYDYRQLMEDGAARRTNFRELFNAEQLASLIADSYSMETRGSTLSAAMRYYLDQTLGQCYFPN